MLHLIRPRIRSFLFISWLPHRQRLIWLHGLHCDFQLSIVIQSTYIIAQDPISSHMHILSPEACFPNDWPEIRLDSEKKRRTRIATIGDWQALETILLRHARTCDQNHKVWHQSSMETGLCRLRQNKDEKRTKIQLRKRWNLPKCKHHPYLFRCVSLIAFAGIAIDSRSINNQS